MIQPQDIRHGNYFYCNVGNRKAFIHISLSEGNMIKAFTGEHEVYCFDTVNDAEPIPLTPQILETCGFIADQQKNPAYIIKIDDLSIVVDLADLSSVYLFKSFYQDDGIEFPFKGALHNLQNLHFALTGKELQINF